MSFLNPFFLFGLLAAAIPILIHLLTRRKPREVMFPSLEFLTEVNQNEIRRLRLKQWLLLALRTLAIVAIALAMARPALEGAVGRASRAATTVVAICDRSGSMGAASGSATTLVAEARRVLEDLFTTLGPADELLLVPYDRAPQPVTPRPSSDLARLRAAVQSLTPTASTTDHVRALELAAGALSESHALNRELFWISDFQSAGLPPGAASFAAPRGPWAQTRVYLVPLVPRSRANAGLADVALAPTESGTALSVSAVSFGAPRGDLAVAVVDAAGEIGRGFLNLPERGEAATLLPLSRLPEQGGVASLPDDALALDNRRWFAAGRAGTQRILLREDGPPSPLRLALEAGSPASGLEVEVADAATIGTRLAEADVLVLNDLERLGPAELQAVLDYYRSGGAVFLAFGTRADAAFWNGAVLGEMGAGTLGAPVRSAAGAAWRLMRATAGHPALAGFPARPGEPLSAARFTTIREFTPAAGGARTLLEFDRAHPALVEATRAMVMLAPLDPAASDFAVSGAFLPLVHQAAKVLGRGTAAASLAPGDRYSAPATTGVWRIEDQEGHEVPSALSAAGGAARLTSDPIERPGLYRVLRAGTLRNTFAVNPDPRESDLTPIPEPMLVRAFPPGRVQVVRAGEDLARRVREARYGRELWGWFVVLALLLLAAETVIGRSGMAGAADLRKGKAA
ncbi:MAG TPA: BatA domain-containing protein [Candidatus Eisenbacteria bacterium]